MMITTHGFLTAGTLLLVASLPAWCEPAPPPPVPKAVEPEPEPAPEPAPPPPCPSPRVRDIVMRDEVVRDAMNEAWRKSQEGTDTEHEESFWVVQMRNTGAKPVEYSTQILWEAPGTADKTSGSVKPSISGGRVVMHFHTHPGPAGGEGENGNDKYRNDEASDADREAQEKAGVPSVIRYGSGPEAGAGKTFDMTIPQADGTELPQARRLGWKCPEEPPPEEPPPGGPPACRSCARSTGDPHFVTHDGRAFDLQAAGEFVAVAVDGASRVQLRMQPASSARLVSINTAVAMQVGGARVSIRPRAGLFVDGAAVVMAPSSVGIARQSVLLQVGDTPTVRTPQRLALTEGGSLTRYGEDYVVDWPDGSRAWVQVHERSLDLFFAAPEVLRGRTSGLLGSHDGARDNDLQTRDGEVLGAADHATLHGRFADSWRVGPAESLFDYAAGETTEGFTDRTMPAAPARLESLEAAARRKAARTCERAGITDAVALAECTLDVALAGDLAFVRSAQAVQTLVDPRPGLHPTGGGGAARAGADGPRYRVRYAIGQGAASTALVISVDPPRHAMIHPAMRSVFDGQRSVACTGEGARERCWATDEPAALGQFEGVGLMESPETVRGWLTLPNTAAERHEARTIAGRRAACKVVHQTMVEMTTCHDLELGVLLSSVSMVAGQVMLDMTAAEFSEPRTSDFVTSNVTVLPGKP